MDEHDSQLPSRWFHFIWTALSGALIVTVAITSVIRHWDPFTVAALTVLALVFIVFMLYSVAWQNRTQTPESIPAAPHLLLTIHKSTHLPVGESEAQVAQAMTSLRAPKWFGTGANTLISLGLAGTFLGLTLGLFNALPYMTGSHDEPASALAESADPASETGSKDIDKAMEALLDGAKLAFLKSLMGILLALLWGFRLLEVQAREEDLRAHLQSDLDRRHPPISLEQLSLLNHSSTRNELASIRARIDALGGTSPSGTHVTLAGLLAGLQGGATDADPVSLSTLAQLLRAQQGEVEGSAVTLAHLHKASKAVEGAIANLSEANRDLFEQLPEKLATPIGTQVGSVVAPELSKLSDTMSTLSATGADAFGAVMSERVGSEVDGLQTSLAAVSAALAALPAVLATGSQQAIQSIDVATQHSATQLSTAATAIADQTHAAGSTVAQLDATVARLTEAIASMEGEGQRITTAFAGVAAPLTELPPSLQRVREGIDATSSKLREDVIAQLTVVNDGMRAQTDAQRQLTETVATQRDALDHSGRSLLTNLQTAERHAQGLAVSVETLREACQQTVVALQAAAGTQQQGAEDTIQQLLAAVEAFNASLSQSQASLRDASLHAVASTEQVTAAAAREVAEALAQGARSLTKAMERAETVGSRLDGHGAALEQHLQVAESALGAMRAHSDALTTGGTHLTATLQEVAEPLVAARESLRTVPQAVDSATSALSQERVALTGLGTSLQEQASLIRTQEHALTARTEELKKLHEVLGSQWTGHVSRLVDGHERVKEAWKIAMASATHGQEQQAQRIASYAREVDSALGLKGDVQHLSETLAELADALDDVKQLGPAIESLAKEVNRLGEASTTKAEVGGDYARRPTAPGKLT